MSGDGQANAPTEAIETTSFRLLSTRWWCMPESSIVMKVPATGNSLSSSSSSGMGSICHIVCEILLYSCSEH